MTDEQEFVALMERFGVHLEITKEKMWDNKTNKFIDTDITEATIAEHEGYCSFRATFDFNKDGSFKEVSVYE